MIAFNITHTFKKARTAVLSIGENQFATPAFIPVSTGLNIKATFGENIPSPIIFADIYRPMLRPGLDLLKPCGLKKFINYQGLLFMGAGSYEMSKQDGLFYKSTEDGINYASYLDGSRHHLSPEISIRIQKKMGADIFSALYDFPRMDSINNKKIGAATRRSDRWTKRAMTVFQSDLKGGKEGSKAFFAPISGGSLVNSRIESTRFCVNLNPDGFLQTPAYKGEPRKTYFQALESSVGLLPADKPCAFLDVHNLAEMKEAIRIGADIIIADFPVSDAMRGIIYVNGESLAIRDDKFATDLTPLPFANEYTYAYLHHLFSAGEILGIMLAVTNNLIYISNYMKQIHSSIAAGNF